MSLDTTRLLVLGCVRQEQPASGYAIMRELSSWGVRDWASINPGSIYGALKAMLGENLVALETAPPTTRAVPTRAHKNSAKYSLTEAGEQVFISLLRQSLEEVEPFDPAPFMAGLCFLVALPRETAVAALECRAENLDAQLRRFAQDEREKRAASGGHPMHAVEFIRTAAARLGGELAQVRALRRRLLDGDYSFAT